MNKHFNINYADQESEWKDLTIIRLLSEISDLEERIDNEIEILNNRIDKAIKILENVYMLDNVEITNNAVCEIDKAIDILKGSDKE